MQLAHVLPITEQDFLGMLKRFQQTTAKELVALYAEYAKQIAEGSIVQMQRVTNALGVDVGLLYQKQDSSNAGLQLSR